MDWTNDEFRKLNGQIPDTNKSDKPQSAEASNLRLSPPLPASVDWRTKNALTPVKNQGSCGSCWAFSAVETLESREFLKAGKPLTVLSEQMLVDCEHLGKPKDQGCGGGEMTNAFKWMVTNGIAAEKDQKTTNSQGSCKAKTVPKTFTNITGYTKVEETNVALTAEVVEGPVSIGVDAGGIAWQLYFGGIIKNGGLFGCKTAPLDHGVVVVG